MALKEHNRIQPSSQEAQQSKYKRKMSFIRRISVFPSMDAILKTGRRKRLSPSKKTDLKT
jgi:hypothetical protein